MATSMTSPEKLPVPSRAMYRSPVRGIGRFVDIACFVTNAERVAGTLIK